MVDRSWHRRFLSPGAGALLLYHGQAERCLCLPSTSFFMFIHFMHIIIIHCCCGGVVVRRVGAEDDEVVMYSDRKV